MGRLVGIPRQDDPVSEMLLRLSVRSTVYCLSEMRAPWGFRVAAREVAAFHLMTAGHGWLEVDGVPEAIRLDSGDLVILPRGNAHQVRNSRTSPIRWLEDILAEQPPRNGRLAYGGVGERSELVCGGFGIEQVPARPLITSLPTVVHLRGHDGRAPEWLSGLVRMVSVEMAADRPGTLAVVSRLTDALLAQALRSHLETATSTVPALDDTQVAKALRLMRERPNSDWSVSSLASAVGLSRSAFATRFRTAAGEPPMRSLTRYRMERAASFLRTSAVGLDEIARETGYDSEVSMSKAFRREFGMPPGSYRRASRSA
jgi:AraC-like DNA-binding protein